MSGPFQAKMALNLLGDLSNLVGTLYMKNVILVILICCGVVAANGQGFTIATGEPLHSHQQELKVKGRNGILIRQKLSFGDYHTLFVKRSAIRKWSGANGMIGTIWTEHMEGRQTIHFSLNNGNDTSDVMTATNVAVNDLLIGTPDGQHRLPGSIIPIFKQTDIASNNYSVSITTKQGEQPWELYLDNTEAQVRRKHAAGYIVRGDVYYSIEPVWQVVRKNGELAEMPFGSPGFEIKNNKQEVMAAVSLIDNGKVYLGPGSEEERFLFANACAALLLQSVID